MTNSCIIIYIFQGALQFKLTTNWLGLLISKTDKSLEFSLKL